MKDKTLTDKQSLFIRHYLENGRNGTQAAKAAGYRGNNKTLDAMARQNLAKPRIRQMINEEDERIKNTLSYSAKDKREMLWNLAQKNAQLVTKEINGEDFTLPLNSAAAVQALAELNKMDGDHSPKKLESVGEIKVYLDADDRLLAGFED